MADLSRSPEDMHIRLLIFLALALASRAMAEEILQDGPLRGLDVSGYAPEQRELLKKANEDCIEIENFRLPKHAEPSPSNMTDGGSRYFYGSKYSILLRRSNFPSPMGTNGVGKILGSSFGYELFVVPIEELDKHAGMHPLVSKVWFVATERVREFEKSTSAELQKRMPPLEKYYRLVPVEPKDKGEANKPAQTTPGS